MSNMYGPEDHFKEDRSHAMSLFKKYLKQKNNLDTVNIWEVDNKLESGFMLKMVQKH